jgi:exosortase D (VPLPA-CTERM-specific)
MKQDSFERRSAFPIGAKLRTKPGASSTSFGLILPVVAVLLACSTAWDGVLDIYRRWAFEEEYGYGFLVLGVVGLLLWRRWPTILANSSGPRWPGILLVLVSQIVGLFGALGESYFVQQIALILTLLGVGLTIMGFRTVRVLGPLAALLMLAVPLPYTLQAVFTVKLQLISTEIGVAAIRLLGIPVFVEGNIIDLGSFKLHVAEACSGLRYLLPLISISFMLAYLYEAPFWKKFVLVVSATPITILINSFRIAIVAVLVDNFGPRMAEGFTHQLEGWVIFLLGTLVLGLEIFILEGFTLSHLRIGSLWDRPVTEQKSPAEPFSLGKNAIGILLACGAGLVVISSIAWAGQFAPKPQRLSFDQFPRNVAEWRGRESYLEPEIVNVLKATDYYIANYATSPQLPPVDLFVSYYESLAKGAAIHSPRVCLPGNGWEFAHFEERNFAELLPAAQGTYNRVIIQKGEQKILMYYWLQQRERRTASEFVAKFYVLWDGITKHRKDGALVRIHTPISPSNQSAIAEAEERLRTFSRSFLPMLPNYVPL